MNMDEICKPDIRTCNTENGKKMIEMLESERKRIVLQGY